MYSIKKTNIKIEYIENCIQLIESRNTFESVWLHIVFCMLMLNRLLFVLVHVWMRWFWTIKYIKMVQYFNCDTFLFTFQCLSLGGKFHSCSFVFSLFTYRFALRIFNVKKWTKNPNHRWIERKCDNVQVQIVAPVPIFYGIGRLGYNIE